MPQQDPVTFGLLGRHLGHSWSPKIHSLLGSVPYALIEREPDEVAAFIREGSWKGLNVTIPYKRQAAKLADEQSDRVRRLGVANTLVRRSDQSIYAENTDVLGFSWMLRRFFAESLHRDAREALDGQEVLVLGSGGACQAVRAALEDTARCLVSVISRSGSDTYQDMLQRHGGARLIVNTTPVGMYPNCPQSILDEQTLASFPQLLGVLDVVYNPERTGICLAAEACGIPYESGLAMLVSQAFYSSQLFQDRKLDEALVTAIERDLRSSQRNIVLIGMPGAGKTTTGRALARLLGRPFIDLDDAFSVETGMSAAQYIEQNGEDAFRTVETEVASQYGARSGLVIACGGGIVTQERNYPILHQNGVIAFIDRPIDQLSTNGRPVSQTKGVHRLAEERMGLYRAWSDIEIACTGSAAGDASLLNSKLKL
ncbi:MAG: shikimate kinase [Atopobiaceae bacterium]|nr:shikimate kinase [Atopobiaceae bacterium]